MDKLVNLTGKRFGYWTVLSMDPEHRQSHIFWPCRCVCGEERMIDAGNLRRGISKSCGCQSSRKLIDLVGRRFGRWIVIAPHPGPYTTEWLCRCCCERHTERVI